VWAPQETPDPEPKKRPSKVKRTTAVQAKKPVAPRVPEDIVLQAQEALTRMGYQVGVPDGKFGKLTEAGVKRFQGDRHLPQTGSLDQLTLSALGLSAAGATATDQGLVLTDAVNELIPTVDPEGRYGFLAATNIGLFVSFDPTKGWRKLSYGADFDNRTTCVLSSLKRPNTIWVGTAASGILVSRDGGESWSESSDIPKDVPVNTIAQDPQRPERLYAGTKRAFYLSHDGGATWNRRGGNLPFGDFTSILVNPKNGDEIFVGNAYQTSDVGGGVYRTLNAGMTWARIDPKDRRLPSQRIWALAFDSRDQNLLYVGSHSAGVYVVPRNSEALSSSQ
jgi:peptidoglycan hydrolase-like protein with peptidoglycan-binding domain